MLLIVWANRQCGVHPFVSEPFSTYDKVNVLGKGVSHIAASTTLSMTPSPADSTEDGGDPPVIYAVSSNLVRKLRLEESALKPTTARAQVHTVKATRGFCVKGPNWTFM